MMVIILILLIFGVGYLLGQWRTYRVHEAEMLVANQERSFWKDIAAKQASILNPNRHDLPDMPSKDPDYK
jgi:hypothetical protein